MKKSVVLVVDDDELNREICQISLEALDVDVHMAENGEVGLDMAGSLDPDLILLDVMMPVLDGFATLERLQSNPDLRDIPVLMLTARVDTKDVVSALGIGAKDYLRKPFDEAELAARVKTLLTNRQMEKTMVRDIKTGAAMQREFLTPAHTIEEGLAGRGFKCVVYNQSFSAVSGDFFYLKNINDSSAGLFFADTCGHGLSAALISMRILGMLQQLSSPLYSANEYLSKVNQELVGFLPPDRFVAAVYIIFHGQGCIISNVGQPYPVLLCKNDIREVKISDIPLGQIPDKRYGQEEVVMQSGDRLILYSDGIIDTRDSRGEVYGKEKFFHCLQKNGSLDITALRDKVIQDIGEFSGDAPPNDDRTFVIIEKN